MSRRLRVRRGPMTLGLLLVVAGVVLLTAVLVVLHRRPDDLLERLRATPGYDLTIPGAVSLYDNVVPSVAGAGANRTRIWGVVGAVDDVQRVLDAGLVAHGYERTDASGEGLLGEYRLDGTRFRAFWVGLPHRLPGGRFVGGDTYDFVVYTTIENGERADAGT